MTALSRDRALALGLALVAGAAALWLGLVASWPGDTAALLGRAMLATTGKADLAPLLAAYPPIPYVLLSLVEPVGRWTGLDAAGLLNALLVAGLVATYATTLRESRFDRVATAVFVLLFCAHPFTLWAMTAGPQSLLLFWGVFLFGLGLFGFRVTGGVNQLITLTLSLPLLAFTSLYGALIALSSIPFLLLAVPPQLLQRAYASVYAVLLFPLLFGLLALCVMSAILLHDPWGFLTVDLLSIARSNAEPWWRVAAACAGAVVGTLVIAPGMVLRVRTRRPLQSAAVALLGTMIVAPVLAALTGLVANPVEALAPTAAAAALVSARWPLETGRVLRVGGLLGLGLLVALSVALTNPAAFQPATMALTVRQRATSHSADAEVGRYLAGKRNVMFDAASHPEVVAERGSTEGLITATSPAFAVALLRRELTAPYVVVRRHRPGVSDGAIGRMFPEFHERGAPGYTLSYDRGGWRVWSRNSPREAVR